METANNMSRLQKMTFSAMVMALYIVVLCVTSSFSFGAYQIRIATSLYLLKEAVHCSCTASCVSWYFGSLVRFVGRGGEVFQLFAAVADFLGFLRGVGFEFFGELAVCRGYYARRH